jgi:transposase
VKEETMSEIPSDKKVLLSLIHSDPERVADLIFGLVARIFEQEVLILSLREKIREIKVRLGLDSQNSSKPPSSDGYKKPLTRSLRTKSGRKTGGQKGHTGHRLSPVDSPDIIVSHRVDCCPECGEDLSSILEEIERRQLFELPKPKLEVTEHQIHRKACPRCRKTAKGIPPSRSRCSSRGLAPIPDPSRCPPGARQ